MNIHRNSTIRNGFSNAFFRPGFHERGFRLTQRRIVAVIMIMAALFSRSRNTPELKFGVYLKAVKAIVIIALVYFVAAQLADSWEEFRAYDWQVSPWRLAASLALHVLALGIFSLIWRVVIRGFGNIISPTAAFKIAYLSNLGRYIPGKVWQMFGMVYLAKKVGIQEEAAVSSWIVAMVFALSAAFSLGLAILLFFPEELAPVRETFGQRTLWIAMALAVSTSALLIFLPRMVFKPLNIALSIVKRSPVKFFLKPLTGLVVFSAYFLGWLTYGVAFWLFTNSLTAEPVIPLWVGVGAFVLAYQAGYLAFFAPAGIGVRELILTAILTPYLGPVAAGLSVAARVWNLIAEVGVSLIALKIKKPPV